MTKRRELTVVYEENGQQHTQRFNVETGRIKQAD